MWILTDGEVEPAVGRPFVRRGGEADLAFDRAVHTIRVWHRDVVLDDDFRIRIHALDAAYEVDGGARILFGIRGIADDEGKFRDDAEFADASGEFERLGRRDLLVHAFEHGIRTGFGSEENHGGAGIANRLKSR